MSYHKFMQYPGRHGLNWIHMDMNYITLSRTYNEHVRECTIIFLLILLMKLFCKYKVNLWQTLVHFCWIQSCKKRLCWGIDALAKTVWRLLMDVYDVKSLRRENTCLDALNMKSTYHKIETINILSKIGNQIPYGLQENTCSCKKQKQSDIRHEI